ncbi:hypothetical protein ES288_A06G189200v1 [Gossypium darwinii]|uniref:Uncharacterized protein n=1 Tax=Gossypium darwinii TaxID=34276 RepID=A0A5D2G889_GOSDA|nr:hypothetical protein ES288_A06G189200v1 [Gossypium darwinii]
MNIAKLALNLIGSIYPKHSSFQKPKPFLLSLYQSSLQAAFNQSEFLCLLISNTRRTKSDKSLSRFEAQVNPQLNSL